MMAGPYGSCQWMRCMHAWVWSAGVAWGHGAGCGDGCMYMGVGMEIGSWGWELECRYFAVKQSRYFRIATPCLMHKSLLGQPRSRNRPKP